MLILVVFSVVLAAGVSPSAVDSEQGASVQGEEGGFRGGKEDTEGGLTGTLPVREGSGFKPVALGLGSWIGEGLTERGWSWIFGREDVRGSGRGISGNGDNWGKGVARGDGNACGGGGKGEFGTSRGGMG